MVEKETSPLYYPMTLYASILQSPNVLGKTYFFSDIKLNSETLHLEIASDPTDEWLSYRSALLLGTN